MKYNFLIETNKNTSVGKIINNIENNSKVLEFGPGNGRISKYLIYKKKCNVSIIEFDKELFNYVKKFVNNSFFGDIEDFKWINFFKKNEFDYIIFGDVLEHLKNPEKVLYYSKFFLKITGKILITFPNLSHNSVLIDLFNNKLQLQEIGLLDKTHKTFYLQENFKKLFKKLNLYILKEEFTFNQVGNNEISSNYDDLPEEIQFFFKKRLFGEVYQYFYVLTKIFICKKKKTLFKNSNFIKKVKLLLYNNKIKIEKIIFINLYFNKKINLKIFKNINKIKFIFKIEKKIFLNLYFKLLFNGKKINYYLTNAITVIKNNYYFLNNSENIENLFIDFDFSLFKNDIEVEFFLNFEYEGKLSKNNLINFFDNINYLNKNLLYILNEINEYNIILKFKNIIFGLNNFYLNFYIDKFIKNKKKKEILIEGWAYDKEFKSNIKIYIFGKHIINYEIKLKYRYDIIEKFNLYKEKFYGFIIKIKYLKEDFLYIFNLNLINNKIIKTYLKDTKKFYFYIFLKKILNKIKLFILRNKKKILFFKNNNNLNVLKIKNELNILKIKPEIAIIVPIYNVEKKWLKKCINSVINQYYFNWKLYLVDDASTKKYIKKFLKEYILKDKRIRIIFREKNGHISKATNSALKIINSDYIGFLDNDDELTLDALFEVVKVLNKNKFVDFIYTDEDKIDENDNCFNPFYKSDWNEELLLSHNYITHFVVIKKKLIDIIGNLNSNFDGSQDYDFILRATEKANNIFHIRKVLYHWRTINTSTSFNPINKKYAYISGKKALESSLVRRGFFANVLILKNYGTYKINYIYNKFPKVSIIFIDNFFNKECIERILKITKYYNYEILLPFNKIKNNNYKKNFKIKYIFFSNINDLILKSNGDYILLLNSFFIPENDYWLNEFINLIMKSNIGIVTGKLINKFNFILNIGMFLDIKNKKILYPENYSRSKNLGYFYRSCLPRNIQGASENCMIFSKVNYKLLDIGLDTNLDNDWIGFDLSLQFLYILNKITVYCPYSIFKNNYYFKLYKNNNINNKKNYNYLFKKWGISCIKNLYNEKI